VHVLTLASHETEVVSKLRQMEEVLQVLIAYPGGPAMIEE
jgi:hypothetical protein